MKKRLMNILVIFDKLVYQLITLGYGSRFDTISSAAWRMEQKGRWIGKLSRPAIDWLFLKLGEDKHCFKSYISAKYSSPSKDF